MKIVFYMKDPASWPLRARRAMSFFEFLVTDPPWVHPFGGGGIHHS
jgi:hypothetical protein